MNLSADKPKNKAFLLAFTVVWTGLILWNYLTPPKTFSQVENRELAQFPPYTTPTLLDGQFMDSVDTYLNDQFGGRSLWVQAQSLWEYATGKREINDVYIGDDALFYHYAPQNEQYTAANIQGVNAFAARYGIPTTFLLVPSSTYLQSDRLPPLATAWDEGAFIRQVYAGLSDAVVPVNVTPTLRQHADEYIYYRTDHHWTTYGAYLGYTALAPSMGLPAYTPQNFSITTVSRDFLGTNHSRTGFPLVSADSIQVYQRGAAVRYETYGPVNNVAMRTEYESIYFADYLEKKDEYSYFLGQVQPYVTIYTGADTQRSLLLFKDSYAHCLAPMLLAEYSEIRLVDLRYFLAEDYGAYVDAGRYDEALFLYSTDTFAHQMGPGKMRDE